MTTTGGDANAKCEYCGSFHPWAPVCPMVKAFEYYPNGTIKRVEFRDIPAVPTAHMFGPHGTEIPVHRTNEIRWAE